MAGYTETSRVAEIRSGGMTDLRIFKIPNNYAAHSDDYPWIIVTGDTEEEVRTLFAEVVEIWKEEERKDAERSAKADAQDRAASA